MQSHTVSSVCTSVSQLDVKRFPLMPSILHARILERSSALAHSQGLGSLMSLLPIETASNDLSAYIATNVISITDGQLYLDIVLFWYWSLSCCIHRQVCADCAVCILDCTDQYFAEEQGYHVNRQRPMSMDLHVTHFSWDWELQLVDST